MKRAWIVLLSIAAVSGFVYGVDKKPTFEVRAADTYAGHQTQEKITIAAIPYNTDALAATAFGKVKPHERGILPVLVVIRNDTGKALRLDLKTEFVTAEGQHRESIPGADVIRFQGIQKRPGVPVPLPIPLPRGNKKGPLNTPEIEGREFSVRLLPPGESANGFFYFQAEEIQGAQLYLTGIKDAMSGKSYFYFELPLDAR
jgi:hypothetical protein